MIAIPIDSQEYNTESSKLFGNVNMFAIYQEDVDSFSYIKNEKSGNGIDTAKFLIEQGVTKTVYSYMGDGPFNELHNNDVAVYYIGKDPMSLEKIVQNIEEHKFIQVDATNASTYLDPGTATENCNCGCS